VSGMTTSNVNGGVGGLTGAGPGVRPTAPPVATAMAPTAVILMLMGEEKQALAGDSRRGGSLDLRL